MRLFFITLLFFSLSSITLAENLKDKYKNVQKKLDVQKQKLYKSKVKEFSILEDVDNLDVELNRIKERINRHKREMQKTIKEINTAKAEIVGINKKLRILKLELKSKLREMQKNRDTVERLVVLINTENLIELLRMNRYLLKISEHKYGRILDFSKMAVELIKKEDRLKELYNQFKKKQDKLNSEERRLSRKKRQKKNLLVSVKKEQVLYMSMIKELKNSSVKLKEIIQKEQKKSKFTGKGFNKQRGKLPWPVSGKLAIPYGTHKDPKFSTPVFRNGIYISTAEEAQVKAVYDGKVVFADSFKGLGQVIILNHGTGYHTVYANLSKVFPTDGEIISRQAIIGKAGISTVLNNPGIYFEVRYKGKPTDPSRWLSKK